jgi:hypothetical protein
MHQGIARPSLEAHQVRAAHVKGDIPQRDVGRIFQVPERCLEHRDVNIPSGQAGRRPEVEPAVLPVQVPLAGLGDFFEQVQGIVELPPADSFARRVSQQDGARVRVDADPFLVPVSEHIVPETVEPRFFGLDPTFGTLATVGEAVGGYSRIEVGETIKEFAHVAERECFRGVRLARGPEYGIIFDPVAERS